MRSLIRLSDFNKNDIFNIKVNVKRNYIKMLLREKVEGIWEVLYVSFLNVWEIYERKEMKKYEYIYS